MDKKAWYILTDEEKAALSLTVNHSKSSWQAGEILNKAHYKFLEIQARAKHFYKMFIIYFEKSNGHIVPEQSDITWDFQEFILCTLQNRMGYRETLRAIGKGTELTSKRAYKRDQQLQDYMYALANHKDPLHRDLYDLIVEFDRWNNFRILPEILREPSAYKRRNKSRLIKHLKNLKEIELYLLDRLKKKFVAPKNYNRRVVYLPIVCDIEPDNYSLLRIQATSKNIEYISKSLKLYLFDDFDTAETYALLVEGYLNAGKKSCKDGQSFWPQYRTMIKDAYNYKEVNNIISRRDRLKEAFIDMDKAQVRKKRMKKMDIHDESFGSQERGTEEKFWDI